MLNLKNLFLFGALGILTVGCQSYRSGFVRSKNTPPDAVSETPLPIDGAMQMRDWSRSTAFYANGDTPAGPKGFPYEVRQGRKEYIYAVEEPILFAGQAVLLPVSTVIAPPWKDRMYTGATVGPSYTAMPALPPSP